MCVGFLRLTILGEETESEDALPPPGERERRGLAEPPELICFTNEFRMRLRGSGWGFRCEGEIGGSDSDYSFSWSI